MRRLDQTARAPNGRFFALVHAAHREEPVRIPQKLVPRSAAPEEDA